MSIGLMRWLCRLGIWSVSLMAFFKEGLEPNVQFWIVVVGAIVGVTAPLVIKSS